MRKILLFLVVKLLSASVSAAYFINDDEEPANAELFNDYYLQILYSASTVVGVTGVSIGTLMAGASGCISSPELISEGLCIGGISIASTFGFLFVAGNTAAVICYLHNYIINRSREQPMQKF